MARVDTNSQARKTWMPSTCARSHFTWCHGVLMHDRRAGSGRPIVLVHGLGVSSRYMVPTVHHLADNFEARAVDLPGFGRSDKPARALDVGELAAALAAWIRTTGAAPASVVANSVGCQFAVHSPSASLA